MPFGENGKILIFVVGSRFAGGQKSPAEKIVVYRTDGLSYNEVERSALLSPGLGGHSGRDLASRRVVTFGRRNIWTNRFPGIPPEV